MTKTPERFFWAAELLEIKPPDNVLEIGCGAGLLAEQIAGRLSKGHLIAIDKSVSMLEKAKQRNKKFIDNGTASFIAANFSKAELPASYFDIIVAFNVNLFWKGQGSELQLIKQLLNPGGKLYVFYQSPYEIDVTAAEPIKQKLLENSFDIIDVKLKKFVPTSTFAIICKLSNQLRTK